MERSHVSELNEGIRSMKKTKLASMLAVMGGLAVATAGCSKKAEAPTEAPTEAALADQATGCAAKSCAAASCAAKGCEAKPCAAKSCAAKPCAAKPCAAKP
jgi:hypothetical protein